MRLSKREAKARTKLIQENHYNKEEQRILDEAAVEMPRSYSDLYYLHRNGVHLWYSLVIANARIGRAFRATGVTADELAAAVNRFAAATKDFPAYPFSEAVAVE